MTRVSDVDADPALHRAAAALHRGEPDQGARGARHRPALDVRRDDLDDRRPRLRDGQGAPAPPRAGRRDRHGPARRALRRLRGPRVHGADGGGAGRGRARRARSGCRCCATFYTPLRDPRRREARRAQAERLHDRGDRRGLLRGPPDGHPPRAERPVPGLLHVPGAQGDAAAARARSRRTTGARGRRRGLPGVRRGHAGRAKRGRFGAFVGLRPLPRLQVHQAGPGRRRPTRCRSRSRAPSAARAISSTAARAGPARCSGAARNYPKCDFTTSHEPLGALHDADAGPVARNGEEGGICLTLRRDDRAAGRAFARSAAAGRRAAEPGRARVAARGGRRGGRGAAARGGAAPTATPEPRPRARGAHARGDAAADPPRGRATRCARPTPRVTGDAALDRVPRGPRRARDASPHTRRAYATAVGAATSTGWPSAADPTGWEPAARADAAGVPRRRSRTAARAVVRSQPARRAPLVLSVRAPAGLGRRATRGARSRRRACRAACRRCWRSTRSSGCSRRRRRRAAATATRRRSGSPPRSSCATGRSSRPPTPRACASASSPAPGSRPGPARGEIRVLGKGRKERIGLLGAAGPRRARGVPRRTAGPAARARATRAAAADAGRALPERTRRARSASAPCATASIDWSGSPACPTGVSPHTLRHSFATPPAGRRRGPAGRPGAAGPREPRHDPGLHPRLAGRLRDRVPPAHPRARRRSRHGRRRGRRRRA